MIKEALEYIVGLRKPELMEVNGQSYTDKALYRVTHNPKAKQSICLRNLNSLIDYVKCGNDFTGEPMFLHVVSPTKVELFSALDADRERESLLQVTAELPEFRFGEFIDHGAFCIALQSIFINNEDRETLTKFAGTVENGTVEQYSDDGISQKATIKTGIASKGDAIVPSPVKLRPYRTFLEVEQPESEFIFRMRNSGAGVQCALFEADGGAWRNQARKNIYNYLVDRIKGEDVLIIA